MWFAGPQRSASATDSTGGRLLVQDTRRRSLTQMPEEEDASRRSKSLDGDATIGSSAYIARHFAAKDGSSGVVGKHGHQKSHRTPWGKVKDIIQTRKDSLKKRHRHGKSDKNTSESAASDHEDESSIADPCARDSPDKDAETSSMKLSSTKPRIEVTSDSNGSKNSTSKRQHAKISTASLDSHLQGSESPTSRRLTPVLTITLPSTEELRHVPATERKPPPSPQSEERLHKSNGNCEHVSAEESTKGEVCKRQVTNPRPPSSSAGTSPPVHRRASKWTKVKKAFLTSAPGRREEESAGRSNSVPSSPNRNSSFFDEVDTDELSSGEYVEVVSKGKPEDADLEGTTVQNECSSNSTNIQAEIQKNYEELQQKLSQEFHKKLHEWERMKASSSTSASCRAPAGEDGYHDKGFRRKMEEWERKHPQQNQGADNKHRDSVAFQLLDEDNLSPDFRKKLQEWQRIKKLMPAGTASQSTGDTYQVPPQFRKKIAEWQLWRTGSGKGEAQNRTEDQQEWERVKAASSSPSPETVTTQTENQERAGGTTTPSPGITRKDSTGHSKSACKKATSSKGTGLRKPNPKGKSQKEKELQWLEKELHKIEREKQRLEREREKYLEREARLEKMRRAMGSGQSKQEVLIQTSTGFFRFQGISEKFTRRLYEWEKARGIGPEASTFALLDPGYRPAGEGASSSHAGDNVEGSILSRSKSASSVTNLGTGVTNVGTSSLSLNDVEVLEQAEAAALEDSRAASEPHLRRTEGQEDDEPAAVIVDIEDVVEETAAPLPVTPVVQSQTPVYCYAPEEVTRLIDSNCGDSERDGCNMVQRNDSVRTESSYKLLEENMSLLNKLKLKEDICRKLEDEIENLEGKIEDVAKTRKQELQRLRQEETDFQVNSEGEQVICDMPSDSHEKLIEELRARIRDLEQRQERLLREGETLQDSFVQHSEQQAALAQNLVGKMKQLQEANISMASCDQTPTHQQASTSHVYHKVDAVNLVQDLSTQLLTLAEKLEVALADRNREVHNLRVELNERRRAQHRVRLGQQWFSEEGIANTGSSATILPRQSSEELTQLPYLLTNKVLELKEGLNYLCAASGAPASEEFKSAETIKDEGKTDADTTATFVLNFPKRDSGIDISKDGRRSLQEESPTVIQVDSEGNTSPVTCVTITPAFWKKRNKQIEDQSIHIVNLPESIANRDEETSPVNRDSFCSALSSASATSSVCDDEDEDEEIEKADSCVSDNERQEENASNNLPENNNDTIKKQDGSDESEQEKSSGDEGEDIEEDDEDEHDTRNVRKNNLEDKKSKIEQESGFLCKDKTENRNLCYYETEVQSCKGNGSGNYNGRQKKLLKTRRISDTHIGYKRDNEIKPVSRSESPKFGSITSKYNVENNIEFSAEEHLQENKSLSEVKNDHNDLRVNNNMTGIIQLGYRQGYSSSIENSMHHTIEIPPVHNNSYSIQNHSISNTPSAAMPTPENVFVKTTRKIFSPVRRDSKGKTSSVISYVVGESTVPSISESVHTVQESNKSLPLISPVVNIIKGEENDGAFTNQTVGKSLTNRSPPSWMFTRKRSQSSSPALTRRLSPSVANKRLGEALSVSDSSSMQFKNSESNDSKENLNRNRTSSVERNLVLNKENRKSNLNGEYKQIDVNHKFNIKYIASNENTLQENENEIQQEKIVEKTCDAPVIPHRPITPSLSFPPLPHSPNPNRRELFKVPLKETAPSIRMMIAKYNQKLTEQDGLGGRSPEIGGSGSASPVAWRSPVAERRVRAQMEKYQEEVLRALQKDGRKFTRPGGNEVQKSASAGIIRAPETTFKSKQDTEEIKNDSIIANKPPSVLTKPRGILKSSSVGAIKSSTTSLPQAITESNMPKQTVKETIVEKESSLRNLDKLSVAMPPPSQLNPSPSPSSPSSPELGLHHESPPPSRLRALRIQKAKEEFLTRGPGGQSWTSETPSTDTPSASVSPEPFWRQLSNPEGGKNNIGPLMRVKEKVTENPSRLSQISIGSESSYDGSVVTSGSEIKNQSQTDDEGVLLVKSASAGMINVDQNTYRKFYEKRDPDQPSTSGMQENKAKSQCGKFGISSITSRFRKVKMRKKEKESGKMNAVSTLCRQSLLVDLHLSKGGSTRRAEAAIPSTSKSCPSSPVLQRSSSGDKQSSSSAHTSWIFNPARKIFKPK
ncbi:hypothetical protein L9F63_006557 [Diploptera punctata]|uniref:Uncharacterized protein n=1 Tax=Diploptera punctata TaxID=6984 RepID=A0AAD7ZAB6_DIPPU|nr:hypothetical protein L9F63_006557 [Diploptera punctata]